MILKVVVKVDVIDVKAIIYVKGFVNVVNIGYFVRVILVFN